MAKQIKWGILGPGRISHKFAAAVAALPDGEVIAVGSRSAERAAAFAETHGIANAHGSYAELAADSDVDMVYVSSPHVGHADHACLCLEAGKGVLCEKPMFINAAGCSGCAIARKPMASSSWRPCGPGSSRSRWACGSGWRMD